MYRPLRAASLGFGSSLCAGISPPFLCTQLVEMPPAGQGGGCHLGGGTVSKPGEKTGGKTKVIWSGAVQILKQPTPSDRAQV